jgi:hypothetical protein
LKRQWRTNSTGILKKIAGSPEFELLHGGNSVGDSGGSARQWRASNPRRSADPSLILQDNFQDDSPKRDLPVDKDMAEDPDQVV